MATLMERQLDPRRRACCAPRSRRAARRSAPARRRKRSSATARSQAVRLKDGAVIPADLVVMAVGIRPNVALARGAGLHCERGIVVDDTC